MTKDFSKQRRDDQRPSSRNSSSGRYGEERSPRPTRPHLNRQSVDRAWENGAPQNHADYRGNRNNKHAQPPRDNQRHQSQFDQPSAQYSRNGPNSSAGRNSNRPYGNRQDNYRQNENAPYDDQRPRYSSTDYNVRDSGNSHFQNQRRQAPMDRPASQRPYRDNPRYRDSSNQYGDRNENRRYGYQERDRDDRNRYQRPADRDNRSPRNVDRGNRPYPSRGTRGPNTQNPRWQSRPPTQRGNPYSRPDRDVPSYHQQEEQFEGDYERFDAPERFNTSVGRDSSPIHRPRAPQHPSDRHDQEANQLPDHPVTRLPDGRVLKGPRPVQRRNAQFWNEIANETEELIDSVHTPPAGQPANLPETPPAQPGKPKARPQSSTPRKRTSSAVSRGRKAASRETGTKKKAVKARSTGPKPSKRGFKWPTP